MHTNLSEVDTNQTFAPLPAGEYPLLLDSYEQKANKNGNEYIACTFKVASGPHKGATVFDNLYLTAASLWRLKTFALSCEFAETNEPQGFDTDDLFFHAKSNPAKAMIMQDKYIGKDGKDYVNNKVESYLYAKPESEQQTFDDTVPF